MKENEKFAVWLAGATLRSGEDEIGALTLDSLEQNSTETLDDELAKMGKFDRKGGDFGAEIIGPLVIPILIEAGKQLWAAYLKKLTEKAAAGLADATADTVKKLLKSEWTSNDRTVSEYEILLRAEAAKQGLPEAQTEKLAEALRRPRMAQEIGLV